MADIFSAGSVDYGASRLLAQVQSAQNQQIQKETEIIKASSQGDVHSAQRERAKWQKVKESVGEVSSTISTNLSRLKSIASNLENLAKTINKAGLSGANGTSQSSYNLTFDSIIKSIASTAENSGANKNLIGEGTVNLEYITSPSGTKTTVSSSFAGVDYTITEADGKKWVPNFEGKNLKRYQTYPTDPLSQAGGFSSGVRLDSPDPTGADLAFNDGDSLTFTIGANTASPEQFTGTLDLKGLSLLNAFAYDNLQSDNGRANAKTAVNKAQAKADVEIARLEAAMALAQFYETRADGEVSNYKSQENTALIEAAKKVSEKQNELVQRFEAANAVLQLSISNKALYRNSLFGSIGIPKFFQPMLNINA